MEPVSHPGAGDSKPDASAHIGEDAKRTAKDVAGTAVEKARQAADETKSSGAGKLEGVSRAVHEAADALGRELPQASGFIHSAAEKLESVVATVKESSVEELVASSGKFARQRPAAVFVGSVLAGLALSRFLKSSARS